MDKEIKICKLKKKKGPRVSKKKKGPRVREKRMEMRIVNIKEKMSQPIESKESKRLLFIDQANL